MPHQKLHPKTQWKKRLIEEKSTYIPYLFVALYIASLKPVRNFKKTHSRKKSTKIIEQSSRIIIMFSRHTLSGFN
jgi:hypothetical protein